MVLYQACRCCPLMLSITRGINRTLKINSRAGTEDGTQMFPKLIGLAIIVFVEGTESKPSDELVYESQLTNISI